MGKCHDRQFTLPNIVKTCGSPKMDVMSEAEQARLF